MGFSNCFVQIGSSLCLQLLCIHDSGVRLSLALRRADREHEERLLRDWPEKGKDAIRSDVHSVTFAIFSFERKRVADTIKNLVVEDSFHVLPNSLWRKVDIMLIIN